MPRRFRIGPGLRQEAWSAREVVSSVTATGETILLHLPSGTYLGLDRSAARIVKLLNEDPDPAHAAMVLCQRFAIPFEQALGDVGAVVAAVKGMSAPRTSKGRRPTVAGVRVVTRSWWRQQWRYRLATIQVTAVVVVIEVGLKMADLSRLALWIGVPLATDEAPPPAVGPDDLSDLTERECRILWAVYWVMAQWLYDGTCLRRALTFGWFLRRRSPILRLGMLDDNSTVAHAWIEVDGKAFNAQPVTGTFATSAAGPRSARSLGAGAGRFT